MNDIETLKEIIASSERYKGFVLLAMSVSFEDFAKDKDIDCVQVHSAQIYQTANGNDIVGFCGAFQWKDNMIIPLDGDSYSAKTKVLGYSWWSNKDVKNGLDILVGDDW